MLAPATASSGDATATLGMPCSLCMRAANASRFAAVGLNTRSAEICRTSLSASVCEFASEPLPSTATVFGPGLASLSTATAEVAPVRNEVT